MQNILVEDNGGVRKVILNRPKSLNALNYDVIKELEEVINDSKHDDNVRVLVLKGEGKAFCAGDDLKGMGTESVPVPDHDLRRAELGYGRIILALRKMDKPVLAEVHGYALGAGSDLALASDIVYAADDTTFGLVFAKRGLVAGTVLLPELVGYHKACEYLFTGKNISAEQALEMGIVNKLLPKESLTEEVDSLANELATAPTAAIGLMKRAINSSIGATLDQQVDIQNQVIAASYSTHDYNEGKVAFQEKRAANYLGK